MHEPASGGLAMRSLSTSAKIGFVLLVSVGWIGCLAQVIHESTGSKKLLDYATRRKRSHSFSFNGNGRT